LANIDIFVIPIYIYQNLVFISLFIEHNFNYSSNV